MQHQNSSPPVKEGDQLSVHIDSVGAKGDGIARVGGFVLFIPGTKQGEYVKVKVTKVLKNVGFAEVLGAADPHETKKSIPREILVTKEEMEEDESPQYEDTETFGEEE